jgi:hypothetical protein
MEILDMLLVGGLSTLVMCFGGMALAAVILFLLGRLLLALEAVKDFSNK